jgi:hypothetical protein
MANPQVMGAPAQEVMGQGSNCEDIFAGKPQKILVKQVWEVLECCSIEAKNRYRISPADNKDDVFLYIDEDSGCCERICCSKRRSLTLKVHRGDSKSGEVVQSMYKPFACGGNCCCLRPKFDVWAGERDTNFIGHVDDPCALCVMNQQINDAKGNSMFTTTGSICQLGMCCPCCSGVNFEVKKGDQEIAHIEKMPLTCGECFKKTNRFEVDFKDISDAWEKRMVLASAMLLDLEYFEENKNNNKGGQ